MRKKLFILAIILTIFLPFTARAEPYIPEKINAYTTTVRLNSDATITVEENIAYDFASARGKHGIYRAIPLIYRARGGKYSLKISDIRVTDDRSAPYPFTLSYPSNKIQIKIGDPNQLVSGVKTYVITYTIRRAINFFSDHDELYWNAIGNEWTLPIETAKATVYFPTPLNEAAVQKKCYRGPAASAAECSPGAYQLTADNKVAAIAFTGGSLQTLEGLTVVVGFPKGIVAPPPWWQNALDTARDNWIIFFPVLILVILSRHWYRYGRDAKGSGVIVAEYEAPDNLSPAQTGALLDNKINPSDITAEIIYLAVTGYLKIIHDDAGNYTFQKLRAEDANLTVWQKNLLTGFFPPTKRLQSL